MVISHGGQTPLHGLSLWQTVKTAHRQLALSATSLTAKVPVNQLSISSLSASVQASTLPKSAPSPLTPLTHYHLWLQPTLYHQRIYGYRHVRLKLIAFYQYFMKSHKFTECSEPLRMSEECLLVSLFCM